MIESIKMPQLGESVTEGTIDKWLVKPGDVIKKYQPLADVTTDKVSAEIPSSFTGVIKELIAAEGETYAVGEVVCTIEVEGAASTQPLETSTAVSATLGNVKKAEPTEAPKATVAEAKPVKQQGGRYSPAVLSLAAQHNVDLSQVTGTGMGGRITRKDLQSFIENGPQVGPATSEATVVQSEATVEMQQPEPPKESAPQQPAAEGDVVIPVSKIRKSIAQNMLRSTHEAPHAWMMVEVDVTELVEYRDAMKKEFLAREGFPITYFAFFVKAVAQALKEFPMMNSMWAGDTIIQKKDINVSIAVATDDALFVPVVKHADEKSIKGIAKEIYELSNLTRSGKLRMEHMSGGTFTVNNTGSFGSIQSMGIINYPQAAILQVESIVKKPVLIQGNMIAPRHIVNLCLSLDHRILDGLICGKFLSRVKDILENVDKAKMSVY